MRMIRLQLAVLILVPMTLLAAESSSLIQEGQTKLQAGEIDAAVALFEEAAELDQTSALARLRLGGALLMKQDYRGAIAQFRETLRLDSNNANAFVGMSVAYLHSGRYELARASLEEAIRIDPGKRPEAEPLLAYIDRAVAREHGDRAPPSPGETP
jgi:tetratricopeptide (TPR) repeat protein